MGVAKTLAQLIENFYWPGLRKDVKCFVATCVDCQHTKYETKKSVGLLCPLSVPCRPWEDFPLDFITGLPPIRGNTAILVVVDRFSKGIHLGMLPTQHSAYSVVILFMDIVRKLHGMPRSLVSDRDPLFISNFLARPVSDERHEIADELSLSSTNRWTNGSFESHDRTIPACPRPQETFILGQAS